LKVGKFFAINEPLVKLHVLGENEHMGGKGNLDNIISAFEIFIKKHYSDYFKNKKSLAYNYLRLASLYRDNRQFKKAREKVFQAWRADSWNFKYIFYLLKLTIKISLNHEKKNN